MKEEFHGYVSGSLIADDKGLTFKDPNNKSASEKALRNCYCPYGSIVSIGFFLGILSVKFKVDEQICEFAFSVAKSDKGRMKEIVSFIKSAMRTAPQESAINLDKEVVHRMYCDTCKKIYCYTDDDIRLNILYAERAKQQNNLAISSALGGTRIQSQMHNNQGQNYTDKIVDYKKCPNCGSTCVHEVSDTEYEHLTNNTIDNKNIETVSCADELKKFKELLDIGIITQEEFDAKKKQLLGL
jgi:hypothetical protein